MQQNCPLMSITEKLSKAAHGGAEADRQNKQRQARSWRTSVHRSVAFVLTALS
jgi:hypothetical protein